MFGLRYEGFMVVLHESTLYCVITADILPSSVLIIFTFSLCLFDGTHLDFMSLND